MTITRDGVAGTPTADGDVSVTTRSLGTVTTGRTIVVSLAVVSTLGSHTYTSSSLSKSAGTATIGSPVLDRVAGDNNGDGSFTYAAVWRFEVTSGGTLTIQIAHRASSYPSVDHESLASTYQLLLEDSNGAHDPANGLSAHASGNVTSAGAAAMFGVLACNNDVSQTFTPLNSFSQIGTVSSASEEGLSFTYRAVSSGTTTEAAWTFTTMTSASHAAAAAVAVVYREDATATLDQEGFRFGLDDGAENAHGWAAAQNTNLTRELGSAVLLRNLIQYAGDAGATTPVLRAQKNGAGGYVVVPVGATGDPPYPSVAGSAGITQLTSANPGTVTMPASIAAGELLIAICAGDTSGTMSQSGGSDWTKIAGETNNGTAVCGAIFAKIAAGSDTLSVQFEANDFAAVTFRVTDHGVSNVATDITVGTPATGSSSTPDPPNCNPGVSRKYLWIEGFAADDDDNATDYETTGWTKIGQAESAQTTSSCMAAAAWLQSTAASVDPGAMAMSAVEEWVAFTLAIPPGAGTANELYVALSSNIATGGEATTSRLTGGTGSFLTGRRWDDENGSDTLGDPSADQNTEVEWSLNTQSPATNGDYFDFRVYNGANPLDTYTVTGRLTIGTPAASSMVPVQGTFARTPALRRF